MVEQELDIVIDAMDRSSVFSDDEDISEKQNSSKSSSSINFNIDNGRELVRLYTQICDSQNPIQ